MFRAPTFNGLPALATMLDDIPASTAQIARHLGITTRTLERYKATGNAPRAVYFALFWETRWGRDAADAEGANYGAIYYRKAMGLERANAALLRHIHELEAERATGPGQAANTPFFVAGQA